jgi:4-alpha-glucanotransferase
MKITFKINYYTHWGQQLFITGSAVELGSDDLSSALQMSHTGNGNWEASVEIDTKKHQISITSTWLKQNTTAIFFWNWGNREL